MSNSKLFIQRKKAFKTKNSKNSFLPRFKGQKNRRLSMIYAAKINLIFLIVVLKVMLRALQLKLVFKE